LLSISAKSNRTSYTAGSTGKARLTDAADGAFLWVEKSAAGSPAGSDGWLMLMVFLVFDALEDGEVT
jgi:hypothetical protein